MKRYAAVLSGIIVLSLLIVVAWEALYPDYYDTKNLHYVLWKHHLASFDLDRAVAIMPHAQASERLIVGRSTTELRNRFGFLRSPADENDHLRSVSLSLAQPGETVKFLRNSHYAIYFQGDRAVRVVLIDE